MKEPRPHTNTCYSSTPTTHPSPTTNTTSTGTLEYTDRFSGEKKRYDGNTGVTDSLVLNMSEYSSGQQFAAGTGPWPVSVYVVIKNRGTQPVTVNYQALM